MFVESVFIYLDTLYLTVHKHKYKYFLKDKFELSFH